MNYQPEQMTETEAKDRLSMEEEQGVRAKTFRKVEDYTTFIGEVCIHEGSLIFHFYQVKDIQHLGARVGYYWRYLFPEVLSDASMEFFNAAYPRLRAAYTQEVDSWWFQADGFGHILDLDAYADKFLEKLDEAIEAKIKSL